jgi:hypothetical protein
MQIILAASLDESKPKKLLRRASLSVHESSMTSWPDRSSSATQFAFLRDPKRRAGQRGLS